MNDEQRQSDRRDEGKWPVEPQFVRNCASSERLHEGIFVRDYANLTGLEFHSLINQVSQESDEQRLNAGKRHGDR